MAHENLDQSELLSALQMALHALQRCRPQVMGVLPQQDADAAIACLTDIIPRVAGYATTSLARGAATNHLPTEAGLGLISGALSRAKSSQPFSIHHTTAAEREMAIHATPLLGADGAETGWRYIPLDNGDGVFVLDDKGDKGLLVLGDTLTGGDSNATALEKARQFASINPCRAVPSVCTASSLADKAGEHPDLLARMKAAVSAPYAGSPEDHGMQHMSLASRLEAVISGAGVSSADTPRGSGS